MAENRLTRELETRAVQERPKQWMLPDMLPEPDKQAGYRNVSIFIHVSSAHAPARIRSRSIEGQERG